MYLSQPTGWRTDVVISFSGESERSLFSNKQTSATLFWLSACMLLNAETASLIAKQVTGGEGDTRWPCAAADKTGVEELAVGARREGGREGGY